MSNFSKILYYGGQKSGKSYLAEEEALALSPNRRPYYIATYDNSFNDAEMAKRIQAHRQRRQELFITIEEPCDLSSYIEEGHTYLIDCMSMWILNTLKWSELKLFEELERIIAMEANIIFVLNEVGSGVVPLEDMSRQYIDRTGSVGRRLAEIASCVYEVKLGLKIKLK